DEAGWKSVCAGLKHACGVRLNDTLACWGLNEQGQLGLGDTMSKSLPTDIAGAWQACAAGTGFTCAIDRGGELFCWGDNSTGQLGTGTAGGQELSPVRVASDNHWTAVATGESHACAITESGALACWGANEEAQLGIGGILGPYPAPRFIEGGPWVDLAGGIWHTCAVAHDGKLWCWGRSTHGQLGLGEALMVDLPAPVVVPP